MLASDVVVLPSAAEGLPLAVLEAASLGRPVVATAVGGTPELITDGTTGRLVPPGDVDALRAAVSDVLCDPVAARRMAGRAKREVRARFTAQAMVDRTDAVYQAILGPARSSRSTRSERSKLASSADRAGDQLFLTGRDRFGTAAVFSGTWPGLDARADRLLVGEDLEGHGRAADVALAQDPRPEVIGRMHALLADDGVALATGGRPSRLVRRFHAAGFTGSRPFVAWPRGEAPRAFIPIDDPAAVRRVLGPRRSGLRGWLGAARRRAWLIGRSVGRGRGIVVATQGGPPFADLEAWWWTAGLGTVPSKVSWTLLTGGRETRSKVVAVITPYDQDGPGIVVKWGRDAVAATGLIHAATTLDTLAASPVRDSVAHVVDRREDPGGVRIVESMLSGRPLAQVVDHGNHATLAMHAAEWLASLAQGRAAIGVQDWWVRAAGPIVDRFAADVPGEPDLLSATRQQLRAVGDLPMLIEHRDFAPWNILVDADDRLHPTDWESAVEGGLPVLDLWYLLTYLALAVEREPEARLAAIYPRLVDPTSRTGAVSQQALERYARLIDIDIAAAAPLRALTWMVHLPSEIARARRSSTPSTMTFARLWAHEAGMLPASQMDRMQGTRNLDTTRS
jgi:hypothetical protein